jgi:hypothetical protein
VRNASNYLTFDSVELPVEISTPRTRKKAISTVSIEIHKGAICDRLKIKVLVVTEASHQII